MIAKCEMIPMLQRYEFADDWEDGKLKPKKLAFSGKTFIKNEFKNRLEGGGVGASLILFFN